MLKNFSKYSLLSFIPFLTLGAVAVLLFLTATIPPHYLFFTLIGWILIAGLGIEVGYHRMFSHGNFSTIPRWKENLILFLGALGGQGSSISWAAAHRQHHRHSDTVLDPHSPVAHSRWHSFFGWTNSITESNNTINFKYSADLIKKSNHVWFHKHQLTILWLVPIIIALYDWRLSLALVVLPSAISTFVNNAINVVCHSRFMGNYRNYETKDNSQNNLIIGPLSWGLAYHNNHHYASKDFLLSKKWWEFDPCKIFIPLLK